MWAVLVVVPLAIPDFVVSFGWASLSTWVAGLPRRGARDDARGLPARLPAGRRELAQRRPRPGGGRAQPRRSGALQTFWRITLGQARGAILGGCLLVALVLLAEYGAFEILGFQTFTTEIFTEFNVSLQRRRRPRALSLVLVVLSLLVLVRRERSRAAAARVSRTARSRSASPCRASPGPRDAAGARGLRRCSSALALGVPVGASVYWILEARARAT